MITNATLCIPTTKITWDVIETVNEFFNTCSEMSDAVIVMDGAGPKERLDPFRHLGNRLKVVDVAENQGPAHARNLAAKLADTDTLIFVDYDVLTSGQAFRFLAGVKEGQALLPAVHPQNDSKLPSRFFSDLALAPKFRERKVMGVSACFSIKKSDYFKVQGFDERFKYPAGEDWDFFSRLQEENVELIFDSNWRVFHQNPTTILGVARRAYRYGRKGLHPNPAPISITETGITPKRNLFLPVALFAVVLIFPIRFVAFSLAVGQDRFEKLGQGLYWIQKAFNSMTYLHIGPLFSFGKLESALNGLQTLGVGNPWNLVIPISDHSIDRRKQYRVLVLIWRTFYIAGVLIAGREGRSK